tara:strand:+ start:47912 stop:48502 length:591 start_codon:yes stop_codon:yes gene_type:complete
MANLKLLNLAFGMSQKILLSIDSYAFDNLRPFQNKTIKIQVAQIGQYNLQIENKALSLIAHDASDESCHCLLSGPLNAYLDIIFKYKRFVPGQGIEISGETAIAQALFETFQNLDPDWASQFEKRIPKPLVALSGNFIAQCKQIYQRWQQERKEDIKLYLQNEANILVPRAAFHQFCQDINSLKNRILYLEQQNQS